MSEFIGSRISLVSKSDIRYVGTLHEIDSVQSTVALENVISFGTEGRRGKPEEEIPPSDQNYEYIVFRGSDVKDLKIEEGPAVKENRPPQPPHDPAILGAARPIPNQGSHNGPPPGHQQQWGPPPPGPFGQDPNFYPPYDPRMHGPGGPGGPFMNGRGGPMPPQGYPPMHYGPPPPGWMGPPPPGQFGYGGPGSGPFGQFPPGPSPPGQGAPRQNQPVDQNGHDQFQDRSPIPNQQKPVPTDQGNRKSASPPVAPVAQSIVEEQTEDKSAPPPVPTTTAVTPSTRVSKPNFTNSTAGQDNAFFMKSGPSTAQSKSGRIMPAVPLVSPQSNRAPATRSTDASNPAATTTQNAGARDTGIEDATALATAAVAAAMANLPKTAGANPTQSTHTDNLTNKLNEMSVRAHDHVPRAPRIPNGPGFAGRGRGRGPRPPQETRKVDVPDSDFNFAESNAKFSKDSAVKDNTNSDDIHASAETSQADGEPATTPVYNKKSSFFDDLSSEQKDRVEGNAGQRPGGREWRGEEQKKNLDTFGQGSVDNGYRGGHRGRGRGGRGRGRGFSVRGRGGGYGGAPASAGQ